jgi:subtilisin-like proprotein convertase family protein
VRRNLVPTRIVLVVLLLVLSLPIAQIASPVEAKKRSRTITRTLRNPATIDLPMTNRYQSPAVLYPSPITVSGLKGPVRDVNLRLIALSHNNSRNVFVLLVGPNGQTALVMGNNGGPSAINAVTLQLDDEAAAPFSEEATLQTGAYRPSNPTNATIVFPDSGTSAGANAALSVFDGTNPNGTWRLFVVDRYPSDAGAISGGWELEITAKGKTKKKKR